MPLGVPSLSQELPTLRAPAIFGSKLRTAILMLTATLEETYPAELARYLKTSISNIQRALDRLEIERLIATRPLVVRAVTLNPLFPGNKELRAFLLRLVDGYPEYGQVKEAQRQRPRRRGKLV